MLKILQKKSKSDKSEITSNQYINVADIKNNMLYTKDNNILIFIKLGTVSISTMSKTDINLLTKILCSEFASLKHNLRLIKISRPIDISALIGNYRERYRNSINLKEKELLREATLFLHKYSVNGNELENEYYFIVSSRLENYVELEKSALNITRKFQAGKITAKICTTQEIVRLCNIFSNSTYGNLESADFDDSLAIINEEVF